MRTHRTLAVCALLLALGCGGLKRCAYEGLGRDRWQQPERVVAALALAPGARVADLGAGGGYFTFRLADAVGPEGRVYAVDVDPDMTGFLTRRAQEEKRPNVEVILAPPDDPRLPPAGVDLVFLCNTYHHIEQRGDYFARVRAALRPGGRLAIVEYREGGFAQWLFPHATGAAAIRAELEAAGYRLVAEHAFLSRQSFLVFAPAPQP